MKKNLILATILSLISSQWLYAGDNFISEGTLLRLGYSTKGSYVTPPSRWEETEFNLLKKTSIKIKAIKPVRGEPNTYYRFTIIEEQYPEEAKAKARLLRVMDKPPGLSPEENKAFPLREAFQRGTRVYIVSTDVLGFIDELTKLTKAVKRELIRESR